MNDSWRLERLGAVLGDEGRQAFVHDALDLHAGALLDATGLAWDDLGDLLGREALERFRACAVEDALACRVTEAGLPDGTGLDEPARAWLSDLAGSVMSLYEVRDGASPRSVELRDILRGGAPVSLASDAAGAFETGQILCARILAVEVMPRLAEGWLSLSAEAVTALMHAFRDVASRADGAGPFTIVDETLRGLAPLFTSAWLTQALEEALMPAPAVRPPTEPVRHTAPVAAVLMPA